MRMIQILLTVLLSIFLLACKTTTTADVYGNDTDEQIFTHAEAQLAKGNYEAAIRDLEALDSLYPFGRYSEQGHLVIIYAYHKHGDSASALAAADRYIRLYPRSSGVEYALYMKGLANVGRPQGLLARVTQAGSSQLDMNSLEAAYKEFSVLVERFPNSKYAPEARQQMNRIVGLMSQHQLEVAQYYMSRKAYVAAANRATRIVKEYPGTPQVGPALGILVEAYTALGETEMANDARRRMNGSNAGASRSAT
ncbi:MAG: comL [Gammaproteobacteria bacterium]|nr:comL [Gammaproteobacteria bacterium]